MIHGLYYRFDESLRPPPEVVRHIVGLDLGQQMDFSALALLESTVELGVPQSYRLRLLRRWALGTAYVQIVADLAAMFARPDLRNALLVVDQTGVGRPVVEMIERGLAQRVADQGIGHVGVTITSGHEVNQVAPGRWNVPKRVLVSMLSALLQSRRLQVARALPEARTLIREMETFKVKVTLAGNESFESWRERDHDDLVLATALAAWAAEKPIIWPPPQRASGLVPSVPWQQIM